MSKPLKLSKDEGLKSIRDAGLIALGAFLPQVLDTLQVIDFGEYTPYVQLACAMIMPLLNRFLRAK